MGIPGNLQNHMIKQVILLSGMLFFDALPVTADVADPGFENLSPGTDLSTGTTIIPNLLIGWGIDSFIISLAESGIVPLEGSQMARANAGSSADLYTLIDLTPFADSVANGQAIANISAYFNSVSVNEFEVSLRTFSGAFNFEFSDQINPLSSPIFFTDSDSSTWESGGLFNYGIAPQSDFLLVGVHTLFDVGNPSYIDNVVADVMVIPEPGTVQLLTIGLLLMVRRMGKGGVP